ncbi:hypothetical protein [Aeromicrobium sp. Root344]|uniref:hypothetical protein n=1 Tax=Aeromicrobium sp. Root344 TaxID=1736521 RepID=UPI000A4C1E68|nr:hypothetical protein [Aeromicrobium sp. Root344]
MDQATNPTSLERRGKAIALFEFLTQSQILKEKPVRTIESYEKVIWLADVPEHPAVEALWTGEELDPSSPILSAVRVPASPAPPLPAELRTWVSESIEDPAARPNLIRQRELPHEEYEEPSTEDLQPANEFEFERWVELWDQWAQSELEDRPAREFYKSLFSLHLDSSNRQEEFELVLGVGCLSWEPANHDQVLRHVLTTPIEIALDDATGRISVGPSGETSGNKIELEMLDPGMITSPDAINALKDEARDFSSQTTEPRTRPHRLLRQQSRFFQLLPRAVGGRLMPMVEFLSPRAERESRLQPWCAPTRLVSIV